MGGCYIFMCDLICSDVAVVGENSGAAGVHGIVICETSTMFSLLHVSLSHARLTVHPPGNDELHVCYTKIATVKFLAYSHI